MFLQAVEAVNYSAGNHGSLASPTMALTVTPGDLVVVAVAYGLSGTTPPAIQLTDAPGDTFIPIDNVLNPTSNTGLATFYATNAVGGSVAVTATFNPAIKFPSIYVSEYRGLSTVVNHAVLSQSSAPTTADGVSISLTQASSATLIWGLSAVLGTTGEVSLAPGTGFTARGGDWSGSSSKVYGCVEDRPWTAPGTEQATWTAGATGNFLNAIVLFQ